MYTKCKFCKIVIQLKYNKTIKTSSIESLGLLGMLLLL